MDVFKRMIRKYEEQKEREYELANPCTHEDSDIRPFTWDGRTMCGDCCEHEYADKVVDYYGGRLCMLCAELFEPVGFRSYIPLPGRKTTKQFKRDRRKRIPEIRVFDENGKRRRVRYWKLHQ